MDHLTAFADHLLRALAGPVRCRLTYFVAPPAQTIFEVHLAGRSTDLRQSSIGRKPVLGRSGQCTEKAVGKIGRMITGRPVNEETGWKPILHCAPTAQAISQADPAGRSADPQPRATALITSIPPYPIHDRAGSGGAAVCSSTTPDFWLLASSAPLSGCPFRASRDKTRNSG